MAGQVVISPTLRKRVAGIPEPVRKFAELIKPGEKVLDLGAGTGHKTKYLVENTKGEIYACDYYEPFVDELRKIVDGRAFKCDVRALHNVPNDYFDKVLIWHVMMFISKEDLDKAIREIKRITKPGGLILYGFYRVKTALNPDFADPEKFKEASREVCEKTGKVIEFKCRGKDLCWCFVVNTE